MRRTHTGKRSGVDRGGVPRAKAYGRALSTLLLCGLVLSSAVAPAQALDAADDVTETQESQDVTQAADGPSSSDSPADEESTADKKSEDPGETEDKAVEPSDEISDKDDPDSSAQQKLVTSRASTTALTCNSNTAYALSAYGYIYKVTLDDSGNPSNSIERIDSTQQWSSWATDPHGVIKTNALGIAGDGSAAYAIVPKNSTNQINILRFDGSSYSLATTYTLPTNVARIFSSGRVVGGAVAPDGSYWFEGSSTDGTKNLFFRFDPSTNTAVFKGYINQQGKAGKFNNGDIVFTATGDLLKANNILGGESNQFITIPAQSLASAAGSLTTPLRVSAATRPTTKGFPYYGISLSGNGHLLVDGLGAAPYSTLANLDPNTFAQKSSVDVSFEIRRDWLTDLSSCTYPPTLTVKKNVVDRANSTDQFTMTVTDSSDAENVLGSGTTTGSATGIQDEIVGPIPVTAGAGYTITETAEGNTDLSRYSTSYVCKADSGAGATVAEGTGTSITIDAFPAVAAGSASGENVTCTFTNTPKATEPIGACEPSQLLGVTRDGRVWSAEEDGGATASVGSWTTAYNSWTPSYGAYEEPVKNGVNGLARAADGTMYAYARGYVLRRDLNQYYNQRIRLMVKEPGGTWKLWSAGTGTGTYAYSYEGGNAPIAGTIDPKTGHYVWGGFQSGYFVIREIDLTTGKSYVTGRVSVGASAVNGDIAFDEAGNLFIVGQGGGKLYVTTVTAAELAAKRTEGNAYNSWPSTVTQGTTVTSNYGTEVNGIAAGEHGDLYVSTTRYIYKVNPLSGALVLQGPLTQNRHWVSGTSTSYTSDLASCASNSPTTLTVQKDLRDGGESNDQFTLSVAHEGKEVASATAQTRVSGSTILAEKTGPTWVQTGSKLELTETGANLAAYDSSLNCVIDGTGTPVNVTGAGTTSGSITVPEAAGGKNITCTFTNKPKPAEPTTCDVNAVYLQAYDGHVGTINTDPSNTDNNLTVLPENAVALAESFSLNSGYYRGGVNGLGIASDGTMYGFARIISADVPFKNYVQLMMTDDQGKWIKAPVSGANPNGWFSVGGEYPIAGAVDPVTGNYYFGGYGFGTEYSGGVNSRRITLYEYDGTSITALGQVTVQSTPALDGTKPAAGDFAFDARGNLFMLRGQEQGSKFTITTVKHTDLAAARNSPSSTQAIASTTTRPVDTDSYNVGGIAVLSDGSMALANYNTVWRVDPANPGVSLGTIRTGNFDSGYNIQDLASCASATTITVEKDVVDRHAATDQFELEMVTETAEPFTSGTTTGSDTGLREVIPATPVMVGASYTVKESGAGTPAANLSNYTSTLECTVDDPDVEVVFASAQVTSGEITIPASAAGKNITCTFTNTPVVEGDVTWEKTDSKENPLQGSVWTLTGPSGSNSTTVTVNDCVASTEAGCADQIDKDHRAGYFKVTALPAGAYTLTEEQAPAGYLLSDKKHDFVIGSGPGQSLEVNLGPIVNHLQPALVIPLTGGLGTDLFLIIGGILAALLIAGAIYRGASTRRALPGADAAAA